MKRDMELIRKVLLKLEGHPDAYWSGDFEIEGYSSEEVNYHLLILSEGELITALDASGLDDLQIIPNRLTWKGHEFLDDARNDTVWKRFTKTIQENAGSVSVATGQALLIALAKQQLGLP